MVKRNSIPFLWTQTCSTIFTYFHIHHVKVKINFLMEPRRKFQVNLTVNKKLKCCKLEQFWERSEKWRKQWKFCDDTKLPIDLIEIHDFLQSTFFSRSLKGFFNINLNEIVIPKKCVVSKYLNEIMEKRLIKTIKFWFSLSLKILLFIFF